MQEFVNKKIKPEIKILLRSLIGSKLNSIHFNNVVSEPKLGVYEDDFNHGFVLEFKSKENIRFLKFDNLGHYTKFHELIPGISIKNLVRSSAQNKIFIVPFIVGQIKIWGKDLNWKLMKSELDPTSGFMVSWRPSSQLIPDLDFYYSTDIGIEFSDTECKNSILLIANEHENGGMSLSVGIENTRKLLADTIENYHVEIRQILE